MEGYSKKNNDAIYKVTSVSSEDSVMLDLGIVIPVYKVEKYLKECIDSLVENAPAGVQIYLIDDGSPDDCGKICDSYSSSCPFVTTVHTTNQGVSEARNTGLDYINTKYVTFVDSDDFVSKTYYDKIENCIKKYDVDLYHFKHANFSEPDNPEKDYDGITPGSKNGNRDLFMAAFERRLCFVWDKVYLTQIIKDNNIRFPCGIKTSEDLIFNAEYLKHVKNAFVSDDNIYFHRINKDGVAFNPQLNHFNDILKVYTQMSFILEDEGFGKKEKCKQDKAYLRFIGLYMIFPMSKKYDKKMIASELEKSHLKKKIDSFSTDTVESMLLKFSIVNDLYDIIGIYYPIQMCLRKLYHMLKGERRI